MKKDKAKKFDIRKGHTLNEYFERFGKYYDKGEILSFTEEEKWLMDDHQIYWVIVGPDKVKRYYQLPGKLKRSRHLIRNHEKYHWPIISASLVALVGVMAAVSCYITGRYFVKPYIPPAPDPEWEGVMARYMEATDEGEHPTQAFEGDKALPIYDLANVAVYKFLNYDEKYGEQVIKPRNYLAVARGYTDTIVSIPPFIEGKVHVEVHNALVANDQSGTDHKVECMEESISYSEDMPDLVPRVGKREFYNEAKPFEVHSYTGNVAAKEQVEWLKESKKVITDEEHYTKDCPDKYPYDPFLYIVAKETMGEDEVTIKIDGKDITYYTKISKKGENYVLDMNLNGTSSVERYARRMKYLSGKKPAVPFMFNHLQFEVDVSCELVRSVVDEEFSIPADPAELIYFPSINHLETWYYHGNDIVEIPKVDMDSMDRFPYEKYLK
ncbi:MAG: hypothetical protein MJ206_03115 [Bacilli bacterium]|nr:hypothetical protein [Bacilli bacterium]